MSGNSLNITSTSGTGDRHTGPVVIVGVGNMGGAIARALLKARGPHELILVDPSPSPDLAGLMVGAGVRLLADPATLHGAFPSTILLAVKPQLMATVAPAYRAFAEKSLVVSIAAGTTLQDLDAWLGQPMGLVRCMPNLPAAIGKGMTAAIARQGTPTSACDAAERLLRSVGDFVWLDTEQKIDAVTAVSGSGPAYVFHLVECMAAAARDQGLDPQVADLLARRTVEGAGALLAASIQSPGDLRRSVTSPGGTTEAALKVLMQDRANEALMCRAIDAATRRGRELAVRAPDLDD